jgi:hypothetical protein
MTPLETFFMAYRRAMLYLPPAMDSIQAKVMMMAIALQESQLTARRQGGNGPARGLWQFELGTAASHGGVWGIYLHDASRYWLHDACERLAIPFEPVAIWRALETSDTLAAISARLLLFTDSAKLPALDDPKGAWDLYAKRTWRPGKPHPEKWPKNHAQAVKATWPS